MAVLVCSVVLIILGCLRVGSEFAPQTMGGVRGGVRFKGIFADLYWSVLRSLSWSPRAPKWRKRAHTGLLRCQGGGLNHTTPKGAQRDHPTGRGGGQFPQGGRPSHVHPQARPGPKIFAHHQPGRANCASGATPPEPTPASRAAHTELLFCLV